MKVNFNKTLNAEIIGNKIFLLPSRDLVAEVFRKNYKYIEFHCIPKYDDSHYMIAKLFKHKEPEKIENSSREIFNYKDTYICQNCDRKIMRVYDANLSAFSMQIVCSCGATYDLKRNKNLPENEKKDSEYFYEKYLQTNLNMI